MHRKSGRSTSSWRSLANTQDQIVSIAAMGDIRTGSVRETIISFGVAAWPKLAMVDVVSAPICLGDG
jgi:hypothetical protein